MSMSRANNFALEVADWNRVYDKLYKAESREEKEWALRRIALWRARFPRIPTGMDVTERLIRAILKAEDIGGETLAGFALKDSAEIAEAHSALGFAVIRFVNLITDLNQKGATQRPIHTAAKEFNIPPWIVELRHDSAHSGVPGINRLLDAARYCVQWLEEKYWGEEKPALEVKLQGLKEREVDPDDDDDELEEVNPTEELVEKYINIVDGRISKGESPEVETPQFESLVESLTMAISQNTDEFVELILRPGFFLPTKRTAEDKAKNVNFVKWIPLLEAMYNATMYALPLVLERLLNIRTQRPSYTDRAVAQWFLFLVRQVVRSKLGPDSGAPEEPSDLELPKDEDCKIKTVDHDLPVNWEWLLLLAVRFPHSHTKYYLPVLCFLTKTSKEKQEGMTKMLEGFLSANAEGKDGGDVDMADVGKDDEEKSGGGWELCSDKLPWKDFPLGTIPGKDLCSLPLEINWEPE